jgi:hypothetical protein
MSKKFQTMGSLLRPEKMLKYKNQIEHSGNITYPFYDDFDGYEQCEAETTRNVVYKEIEYNLTIITDYVA